MLNRRSKIPGFQEGGTNVDPVSGNEVPTGSLPEEVRDDVDAKLSPGEFVIPADVVRFIGLERLMKMRDEAKKGLQRMSEIGQMGNAEEVGEKSNSTYEDSEFESEIDDILEEIAAEEKSNGDVDEQTDKMMASGGFIKSGTDLSQAPKNPTFDVRYYKNDQGAVMFITHINGKPMTPIPQGFKEVSQEEAQKVSLSAEEAKKTAATTGSSVADYTSAAVDGRGTGTDGTGGGRGPGQGVSSLAQSIGLGLLAYGQNPALPGAIVANILGKSLTDSQIEALGKAQTEMENMQNVPGIEVTSDKQGNVYGRSSDATIAQADIDTFGTSQTQAQENVSTNMADMLESGAAGGGIDVQGGSTVGIDAIGPGGPSNNGGMDTSDYGGGLAKGGLVNRRQYPAKKKRGKGLAAAK